jgi:hypothetical protein
MSNQTSSSSSSTQNKNESTRLANSTYNIIRALEKDAGFLYSTVGQYVQDAEKDGRQDLVSVWNTIKLDKERHLQMLREALSSEAKKDNIK